MGLFDKIKRGKNNLTIGAIIGEEYEQQYFDECKYIWKNYVPQAGQADNLQGELLREIEKIPVFSLLEIRSVRLEKNLHLRAFLHLHRSTLQG